MKKITSHLLGNIISSNTQESYALMEKSSFGEKVRDKIQYSLAEALFLVEKKKMEIYSGNKILTAKELMKKCKRADKKIEIKYLERKKLEKYIGNAEKYTREGRLQEAELYYKRSLEKDISSDLKSNIYYKLFICMGHISSFKILHKYCGRTNIKCEYRFYSHFSFSINLFSIILLIILHVNYHIVNICITIDKEEGEQVTASIRVPDK